MALHTWIVSSLERQFPLAPAKGATSLTVPAARGERVAVQACCRLDAAEGIELSVHVRALGRGVEIPCTIRRVGHVPMPHHNSMTAPEELDGVGHIPGYVPDVLWPESKFWPISGELQTFWITLEIPRDARVGMREFRIEFSTRKWDEKNPTMHRAAALTVQLEIALVVLAPRANVRVTHWFYADALCDWYKVEPWDEKFWVLCERYMRNLVAHGSDTIYVPMFTPPLDGVKRPTQLLGVKKSGAASPAVAQKYRFDWANVERWITLAKQCGFTHFEWVHLFSQWGVKHALRIYEKNRQGHDTLLWPEETGATSEVYRTFLSQLLPAWKKFLDQHELIDVSFFHLSDEPHADHLPAYRAAREMLRELAPWMKVMDALSNLEFAQQNLTDLPVPVVSTAHQFAEAGIESWAYFCCNPRGAYVNRLLDTPLPKLRMLGWLLHRFERRGFLHWGYNYWYRSQTRELIDPFLVTDGHKWPNWAYGDTNVVYPGPEGPIDSIRWEVFHQSLQDLALLQTVGVSSNDRTLAALKDFADFPKSERWITQTRARLLLN